MKHDEFIEAATDAGEWIESNWKKVVMAAVAVLVLVLAVLGGLEWNKARAREARETLARGMRQFALAQNGEPDGSYDEALRVFEGLAGRGGAVGQVARYYEGVTLLRSGRSAEAVPVLESVSGRADDALLRQNAAVLLAEALAGQGDAARAVEILHGVADASDGVYPGELALVQAGRILLDQGDVEGARRTWQDVVDRFPETPGAQEAGQLLERSAPPPDLR